MNLFQIIAMDCHGLGEVITIVKFILNLVRFIIPLVLIVLITIDLFKAMTSGDEKAIKGAQKQAITRAIYAVVIFLIPTLVSLVFNLIGNIGLDTVDNSETGNFFQCWGLNSKNKNNDDTSKKQCYINGVVASKYTTQAACESISGAVWGE